MTFLELDGRFEFPRILGLNAIKSAAKVKQFPLSFQMFIIILVLSTKGKLAGLWI